MFMQSKVSETSSHLLLVWLPHKKAECWLSGPIFLIQPQKWLWETLFTLPLSHSPSIPKPDWEAREEHCSIHELRKPSGLALPPYSGPRVECVPVPGPLICVNVSRCHFSPLLYLWPIRGEGSCGFGLSWNWRGDYFWVWRWCVFSSLASSFCCLVSKPAGTMPMRVDVPWPTLLSIDFSVLTVTCCWNMW